jgi:hypothetical protein
MRNTSRLIAVLLLGGPFAMAQSASSPLDAKAAFEQLKQLAGEWQGTVMTKDGPPALVRYEVVSNKTAVMETLFPGTDHEMRSVYFMDGGSLVMTHYCAMGNQPHMKLEASASKPTELVFDFTGGTNMDPAKDTHVHSGKITLLDGDHVEAVWTVYQGTRQTGANRFFLTRKK